MPNLDIAEVEQRLGDAIQAWVDLGNQADLNHRWLQASAADVPVLLAEVVRLRKELADAGLLLPPGGLVRNEYGRLIPEEGGRIASLGWGPAMTYVTHVRTVTVWAGEGPNNNWPRYSGPWRPVEVEGAPDA